MNPKDLDRVYDYLVEKGGATPPSLRSISSALDLTLNKTFRIMQELEQRGRVIKINGMNCAVIEVGQQTFDRLTVEKGKHLFGWRGDEKQFICKIMQSEEAIYGTKF